MRKHLILVGGGHAHMVTLAHIRDFVDRGYKVTVIAPSLYHYYSGMGPGMLGTTYVPDQIRFATQKVVTSQGGIFVKDRVVRIDPDQKQVETLSGNRFSYDVISFNAGSHVPMGSVETFLEEEMPDNLYPVKPIEKLMEASERLVRLFREKEAVVTVVGGGPSAAEVAGNIWQLAKKTKAHPPLIRIIPGRGLMSRFAPGVRRRVNAVLAGRGVEILDGVYAKEVGQENIVTTDGNTLRTDFTFMALGVTPSPVIQASGLPVGPDQGLLVNEFLQSPEYPDVFGGGDCIYFQPRPLDKVGVYAVRQNPVLCNNLMAALDRCDGKGRDNAMQPFDPGPDYLLIFNLGGSRGVLKKHGLIFGGRIAFFIKDYIDRRFISRFQAIEKGLG
ncbi:MAG: FAD-dependent oxidoreductase [Desulfobacter sp.]